MIKLSYPIWETGKGTKAFLRMVEWRPRDNTVPHVVGAAEQGSRVLWFSGSLNARGECHMNLPAGRLRAKKTFVIPLCITCRTCSCGKFYISNVFTSSHRQVPRSPWSEAGCGAMLAFWLTLSSCLDAFSAWSSVLLPCVLLLTKNKRGTDRQIYLL